MICPRSGLRDAWCHSRAAPRTQGPTLASSGMSSIDLIHTYAREMKVSAVQALHSGHLSYNMLCNDQPCTALTLFPWYRCITKRIRICLPE
jgi:hypothetical protein